jgi:hypothetical protein
MILNGHQHDCSGMEALQAGDFSMKASKWPAGFYEDDDYDPKNKMDGLFRNHTVVQVCSAYFPIIYIII